MKNDSFVVFSPDWSNSGIVKAGAVTWCPATGCMGPVSPANSLVGTSSVYDINQVTVLSSGNYVITNLHWSNGTANNMGAVTWCSAVGGCRGTVSVQNSLIGSHDGDSVGGVIPLSNGSYLVDSPTWENYPYAVAGAVTWCPSTGCFGTVSPINSLVGTAADDGIGDSIFDLPSGAYLVSSPYWSNGAIPRAGAVTWCPATGCRGAVSPVNSLVGSNPGDNVGYRSLHFLPVSTTLVFPANDGSYIVGSPGWLGKMGAVTWCSPTGCKGVISTSNSLVGSKPGDEVGEDITLLANGSYIVSSPYWANASIANAGAITWCPATGCQGTVSSTNSLVGSTMGDLVGSGFSLTYNPYLIPLENGNFVIQNMQWSNNGLLQSGAVTLASGASHNPTGPITRDNSVLGGRAGNGDSLNWDYDPVNGQLIVVQPAENLVTVFQQSSSAIASGDWQDPATWDFGVPTGNTPVVIGAGKIVSIYNALPVTWDLTIQPGGTLSFSKGSLTLSGNFTNQGGFNAGSGTLIANGGQQTLDASVPTVFNNLTVQPGTTLVELPAAPLFTVQRRLLNQGAIRKSLAVNGSGSLDFGLTGIQINLDVPGSLASLQVDRIDQNPPGASVHLGGYTTRTGTYWSITPTAVSQNYSLSLGLPHTLGSSGTQAVVCQPGGGDWICARSGSDASHVWVDGVSQVTGIWTLGLPVKMLLFAPFIGQ